MSSGMCSAGMHSIALAEKARSASWRQNPSLDIGVRPGRRALVMIQESCSEKVCVKTVRRGVLVNSDVMTCAGVLVSSAQLRVIAPSGSVSRADHPVGVAGWR